MQPEDSTSDKVVCATLRMSIRVPGDRAFRVGDRFMKNTNTEVPISSLGENWNRWFGDMEVPATEACGIEVRELTWASENKLVTDAIGDDICETNHAILWTMMKRGYSSKERWYILHMPDKRNIRRVVLVHWVGAGWRLLARTVDYPSGLDAGDYVVSRKREGA